MSQIPVSHHPRRSHVEVPVIDGIDLDFRPASYLADHDPVGAIVQNITGENRRQMIADFAQGAMDPAVGTVEEVLLGDHLDHDTRHSLGRIHPSFYGGEYLPAYRRGECEIARIVLASVLQDVISIRATRTRAGRYRYRIVDEHEHTLDLRRQSSTHPLTLRELIHLIDTATSPDLAREHPKLPESLLWFELEAGCFRPSDEARIARFVQIRSEVYPELEDYYRARLEGFVRATFRAWRGEDLEEDLEG